MYSEAPGSAAVAFFFTSSELTITGTITADPGWSGGPSSEIDADRVVVDDDELGGFQSDPPSSGRSGKPPTVTARSSDHLTSFAVTGVPSWKVAPLRNLKVTDMSPTLMSSRKFGLILSRS